MPDELICNDVEETVLFQNVPYDGINVDSTFGSADGRFFFVHRGFSLITFDTVTGKTWELTHPNVKFLCGFISTVDNLGILLYSAVPLPEFMTRKEFYLAHVKLNFERSEIQILDQVPFDSPSFTKQMHSGYGGGRFVMLSERHFTDENRTSTFYIYNENDLSKPQTEIVVQRTNDKILFHHLIDGEIWFMDSIQVGLFDDMFFRKCKIRKVCIRTGEVTTLDTGEFPKCDNYIMYGNIHWCVSGKWSQRSFYLSTTMPYSDPEIHLFFVLNTDTREWRRILINTLPSVRKRIVRPSADVDRMHFLRDDRASLFINVVENKEMIIIQPRNWNHKEMACFRVWLTKEPKRLDKLALKAIRSKWPWITNLSGPELKALRIPANTFSL